MVKSIYWVTGVSPGRLAIVTRPRGGDWLADDLARLRLTGFDVVASLLTVEESAELGLTDEAAAAEAADLEFLSLPIPDRGVPRDFDTARATVTHLSKRLADGCTIAVHCRLSAGRSSLIVAALLVLTGRAVDEAWRLVGEARGLPGPDTDAQREWLALLAVRIYTEQR
jgi:protein-tyrosine phosphatase